MQHTDPEDSKRSVILAAAAKLFNGRRFDKVKLEDVAVEAGVGKGTLYLYFKNKEDLFVQMAVDGVDEMAARILEISGLPMSYKDRLFLFGEELMAFHGRRQSIMRTLGRIQSVPMDREFRKHLDRLISAVHELLRKGMDEGVLRSDFSLAELRCALVGPLLLKSRREAHAGEKIELNALLELFWSAAHGVGR